MKYRTDLILGGAFCIFIFFYFQDSGLSVLNVLQFYFWLRDSEHREYFLILTFFELLGPGFAPYGSNAIYILD